MFNQPIAFEEGRTQKNIQFGISMFRALDLPFTAGAGTSKIIAKKGVLVQKLESMPVLFTYEGASPIPASVTALLPPQENVVFQIFKGEQLYGEYQVFVKQNFNDTSAPPPPPGEFDGQAGNFIKVNPIETGYDFVNISSIITDNELVTQSDVPSIISTNQLVSFPDIPTIITDNQILTQSDVPGIITDNELVTQSDLAGIGGGGPDYIITPFYSAKYGLFTANIDLPIGAQVLQLFVVTSPQRLISVRFNQNSATGGTIRARIYDYGNGTDPFERLTFSAVTDVTAVGLVVVPMPIDLTPGRYYIGLEKLSGEIIPFRCNRLPEEDFPYLAGRSTGSVDFITIGVPISSEPVVNLHLYTEPI